MRDYFLDRDLVISKDGSIYSVFTNYDMPGYIFAYLKYVYTGSGLWRGYERVFRAYGVHNLIKLSQDFVYEPCYDASFPIILKSNIKEHLRPEDKLREILSKSVNNNLELILLDFIEKYIGTSNVGIGGSLLAGISHEKSDIDIIVYGHKKALDYLESFPGFEVDKEWILEANSNYGIDFADLLYDNRRRGIYKGRKISVLFVDDKPWRYCEHLCRKRGRARIRAKVFGDYEALIYPAKAYVSTVIEGEKVNAILSYEGLYSSALFGEKEVIAEGMMMECDDGNYILVGDRDVRGFVKPLT